MVRKLVYRECVNKWERFINKFDEIEELSINLVKIVCFFLFVKHFFTRKQHEL